MGGALSFTVGPAVSLAGMDVLSVVFYIVGSVFFVFAAVFNLMVEIGNNRRERERK